MEPQGFDFTIAKTVNGLTLEQVVAELRKPLPGATDLTDIDPPYRTEVATGCCARMSKLDPRGLPGR